MDKIADFRKLFECHFTPLVKFSYLIIKDKEQAKDIVQNFFVNLWKNEKLDEIESFEAFAYFSIKNKSISYLRDNKRFAGEIPELSVNEQSAVLDPHFPKYILESAILGLPDKCREVFILSKMEGLTYHEISESMNISVKTIEKHISAGLRKLRVQLAPYKELFFESVNSK